jgi:hypothetical protein
MPTWNGFQCLEAFSTTDAKDHEMEIKNMSEPVARLERMNLSKHPK